MGRLLNKRERDFLKPAIVHFWEIEISPWRKSALWDGDALLPVRVGKMADSLIERGYLERVSLGMGSETIRATAKSKSLRCYRCLNGRIGDNKCPHCDGGILPEEQSNG